MSISEEEMSEVYSEGDTVFFFCDVTGESVRDLCRELKKMAMKYESIKIAINSGGGDLYGGLAAMDFIRGLNRRVETIVYGFCASAATFILMAGTVRKMGKNSWVLIHQMSTGFEGSYQDLRADMKTNKKLMRQFREVYSEYTTIPPERLEDLMNRDITYSARKCLKYNVVDELI
jgi:ATP-dependent Clp endopeptidase proteolytic subunit ClpP